MSIESVIVAHHLNKYFGTHWVVQNISLQVPKGCIYGFLGPNGSGKSTMIRMLTGLLTPSSGTMTVLGQAIPAGINKIRFKIGYMTQKFSLYNELTVEENLRFVAKIFNLNRKQETYRINELIDNYDLVNLKKQKAQELSGGQKQRLSLAAATLHEPDLLFLDEPTSAVDPENRRYFWEKLFELCELGKTVLVSTHYMDEAERCHYLAILESGRLTVSDTPKNLMDRLQANIIEIEENDLKSLKTAIVNEPNILSITQQGTRLRVLVTATIDTPETWFKTQFANLLHDGTIERVRPNLEDVFVKFTAKE